MGVFSSQGKDGESKYRTHRKCRAFKILSNFLVVSNCGIELRFRPTRIVVRRRRCVGEHVALHEIFFTPKVNTLQELCPLILVFV